MSDAFCCIVAGNRAPRIEPPSVLALLGGYSRLVDQLFFKRLMANPTGLDGKALFSAPHKNLLSDANSALSSDSLKKAIQLFLNQTDADGQPINVEPSILLVPMALKFLAQELV